MKKAAPNVHVAINVATILALAAVLGSAVWGYLPTYIFYRVAAVSVIVMLAFYLGHRVVPGITCRFIDRIFGK